MALKQIRIGSLPDIGQYDDGDYDKSMSTEDPIECTAPPVAANDVLRLGDVGTLAGDVYGPAGAIDSNLVEFSGITGKVLKDGGLAHAGVAAAVAGSHTQGTDTALGLLGTKNPPIDADLVIQRDSTAVFALVTSTWTQIKAFLKLYWDTLYTQLPILIAPTAIYFGTEAIPVNQEYDITGVTWVASTNGTPNVVGHLTAACLTAMATAYDGTYFAIREGTGVASDTEPLTVQFNFPGVTTFSQVLLRGQYTGSTSHFLYVELWNGATWDVLAIIPNEAAFTVHNYIVLNPASYIIAGVVRLRIRHIQNGVSSHRYDFDYLVLSTGPGGGGGGVQTAIETPSTPFGTVSATNVQAAINELDTEKLAAHTINSASAHTDTSLAAIANNDLMQWDDPSSKWEPKSIQEVILSQDINPGPVTIGSVEDWRYAAPIADDGTKALPTILANYAAKCEVIISSVGVIDANATFMIDSTGTVTPQVDSGNCVYNVDTDVKLCIGTAAAQNPLTIKYRLGSAVAKIMITMMYVKA